MRLTLSDIKDWTVIILAILFMLAIIAAGIAAAALKFAALVKYVFS